MTASRTRGTPLFLNEEPQTAGTISQAMVQANVAMAAAAGVGPDGKPSGDQKHGGPAQGLEPISKHSASITGKMPGTVQ